MLTAGMPKKAKATFEKAYDRVLAKTGRTIAAENAGWAAVERSWYQTAEGVWKRRKKAVRRKPVVAFGRVR